MERATSVAIATSWGCSLFTLRGMGSPLSRPDPTSPASVAEAGFSTSRRGFNPDEVRAFLTSVAAELGRLKEHERQLEAELRAARAASTGRAELDDETVASMLGEETLRVLQTARESASQIKMRAEENAARVMREAHEEANRVRQDAEVEAARHRQEAQSDAEAEVAHAKQQGREMVSEARAYRERVLADLERRTKLARHHIDELANGRDRLLQVFERARLVAVDITSELQRAVEPEEFVSLAATTGPVPLMVPASKLDETGAIESAAQQDAQPYAEGGVEPEAEATQPVDTADAGIAEPDTSVETESFETVEATEPVAAAESEEATADPPADEAPADAAPADAAPAEPPAPEADASKPRDTNVVALFPNRGAGDEERPDVDGIFARLRSEAVPEPVADTAEEQVESTAFTRRDEALVPLIVTAARKLKRVLADEQNGVLDTLRRKEPVTSIDQIVPALDAHLAAYIGAVADELAAAAAAGAAEFGAKDTKTLRRTLDKAGALDNTRGVVRSDLVAPLRSRLERAVIDGGGDNEETTKRVRAVYREWKTQHIDDQLDDVFRNAFGGGLSVTAEPGQPMMWTIDPTEAACADCEDNSLAGAIPAGEPFPTGHTSAPAHAGCRCLTLPAHQ
jgi:DivIVA domain-containing protein